MAPSDGTSLAVVGRHSHARNRVGCSHGLTGRPTPNLARSPVSRQHHSIASNPSATYQRLRETIAERMRMSHVVQPRRRTWPAGSWERMVGKVLTFNGITRCEQGTDALVGGVAEGFCAAVELSDAARDQRLELCRQRLDAFRQQRGEEVAGLHVEKPAASATAVASAPPSAAR